MTIPLSSYGLGEAAGDDLDRPIKRQEFRECANPACRFSFPKRGFKIYCGALCLKDVADSRPGRREKIEAMRKKSRDRLKAKRRGQIPACGRQQ